MEQMLRPSKSDKGSLSNSFSCDKKFKDDLNDFVGELTKDGYDESKSTVIRKAVREYINNYRLQKSQKKQIGW